MTVSDFKKYIEENNIPDDANIMQIKFVGLFVPTFVKIDYYDKKNNQLILEEPK